MKLMTPNRLFGNGSSARVAVYPAGVSFIALSIVVLAALAFASVTAAYAVLYGNKVYPGVSVLNTNIGGHSEDGAKSLIRSQMDNVAKSELTIHYGDKKWSTTLDKFGLRYDVDKMVEDGFSFGRRGNFLEQFAGRVQALLGGHNAQPAIWFDQAAERKVLTEIAGNINRPPVNAEVGLGSDGNVRVLPSQTGLSVDVDETLRQFEASFSPLSTRELDLVVHETKPDIVETDLAKTQLAGQAIIAKPLTLKAGDKTWTISEKDLLSMLIFPRGSKPGDKVVASLDPTMLAQYLNSIAKEVNKEPKNATLKYKDGQIVTIEGEDGVGLDVDATIAAINAQAAGDQRTVDLVLKTQKPAILGSDLADAKATAEKMVAQPLKLTYKDSSWTLSQADLGDMLVFKASAASGGQKVAVDLDKDSLTKFLNRIAQRINTPAKDARFLFHNGQITLAADSVDGVAVDVNTTINNILSQIRQGNHVVNITTTAEEPKVRSSDKDKIVIKDLLYEASTSYAGSIPERAHNVELATSRLNGVVIPPGGTFSMNQALGPATLAAGFQMGYGITVENGEMETVPSEGGGICQVATTIYHAAFWAGLPIVQRLEHMYWIPRYGTGPSGLKGLDATVDAPYVDFKFKNTTGNWLALQSRTDGSNVYFSIYGTKTGWNVKVDGPKITDVIPADTKMVNEEDPTMPWGRKVYVEEAEDGFVSTIVRNVYDKAGALIDTYTSVSHYQPSRNVTVIGTQGKPAPAGSEKAQGTSSSDNSGNTSGSENQ